MDGGVGVLVVCHHELQVANGLVLPVIASSGGDDDDDGDDDNSNDHEDNNNNNDKVSPIPSSSFYTGFTRLPRRPPSYAAGHSAPERESACTATGTSAPSTRSPSHVVLSAASAEKTCSTGALPSPPEPPAECKSPRRCPRAGCGA